MILVATQDRVYVVDPATGDVRTASGVEGHGPSCMATDPHQSGRAWCGTEDDGILVSEDAGLSWHPSGLAGEDITAVAASPTDEGAVWAGTEPSAVWFSGDGGRSWEQREGLLDLPSSSEWSFPPRPDTHHVRWIACHPRDAGRLWVAIEAGALISTADRGLTWRDRVAGGPYDTHELAVHPARPDHLRAAAGDGYFESSDGGVTWRSPENGLDVGYLRSVAVDPDDPDVVVVSAASHAHAAYVAGRSDGRLYRRDHGGAWERITDGWPEPPSTIAPLLIPDPVVGGFLAADERGVHRSDDGGRTWAQVAGYPARPAWLRALARSRSG